MKMAEYTLMNKNHPVVSFRYDRDIHAVVKVVDVHDLRYAPVALADSKGIVTRRALNDWWRRRAIPASRHQIQQLLDSLNLNSTLELAEENFGLSLSDRYWINDSKNPLKSIFRKAFTGSCRINRAIVCIGFERRDIPWTLEHTVAFRML